MATIWILTNIMPIEYKRVQWVNITNNFVGNLLLSDYSNCN